MKITCTFCPKIVHDGPIQEGHVQAGICPDCYKIRLKDVIKSEERIVKEDA